MPYVPSYIIVESLCNTSEAMYGPLDSARDFTDYHLKRRQVISRLMIRVYIPQYSYLLYLGSMMRSHGR